MERRLAHPRRAADDDAQLAFSRTLGEAVRLRGWEIFTVSLDPARTKRYGRARPYDATSERTLHRTTIAGGEAWS